MTSCQIIHAAGRSSHSKCVLRVPYLYLNSKCCKIRMETMCEVKKCMKFKEGKLHEIETVGVNVIYF